MCHYHYLGSLDTGGQVSECFSDCTVNKTDLDFESLVPASPGQSFITIKITIRKACMLWTGSCGTVALPCAFTSSQLGD